MRGDHTQIGFVNFVMGENSSVGARQCFVNFTCFTRFPLPDTLALRLALNVLRMVLACITLPPRGEKKPAHGGLVDTTARITYSASDSSPPTSFASSSIRYSFSIVTFSRLAALVSLVSILRTISSTSYTLAGCSCLMASNQRVACN
jgi:hypothetical protein